MSPKIQTMADIRKSLMEEISLLYPMEEIESIFGLIIREICGKSLVQYSIEKDSRLPDDKTVRILSIIDELKRGMPIQYILGETIFFNCRIKVTGDVLIPRPETEELVDLVIRENRGFSGRILDLGTGSGCIAVALALNLPRAEIIAVDRSEKALSIAKENSMLNNVFVDFVHGDIFKLNKLNISAFNIIVSNPPYVTESEKQSMHINVVGHEPPDALFVSDEDPLVYYRMIFMHLPGLSEAGGKIYLEINEKKGAEIRKLAQDMKVDNVEIIRDLNGKERIFKGVWKGKGE